MHFSVTCPACHTEFPVDSDKVPPDGVHAICSTCERVFPVDRPEAADEAEASETEATLGAEPADEADAPGAEATLDAGPTDVEEESPPEAPEVSEAREPSEAESVEEFEQFFEPVLSEDEPEDSPGMEEEAVEEPQLGAAEPEAAVEGTEEDVAPDADEDWSAFDDELTLTEEAEEEEEAHQEAAAQVEEAPAEEPAAAEAPRFGQRDPDEKAARLARVLVQDIIAYNQELYQKALEEGSLEEDFEDEIEKSWEEYVERIGEEMATSTTYFKDALNEILAKGDEIFDGPP